MNNNKKLLGDLLVETGILKAEDLKAALDIQRKTLSIIIAKLIFLGFLSNKLPLIYTSFNFWLLINSIALFPASAPCPTEIDICLKPPVQSPAANRPSIFVC